MADKKEPVEEEVAPVDESKNKAVTGRPNDLTIVEHEWALSNSTLASRAKKRVGQNKRVKAEDVESK